MIRVFVVLCSSLRLVGVFGVDEVKTVSVMEGDSVTLNPDLEVQRDDQIKWKFGDQGALIALIDDSKISILNGTDGRFRGRLKLDHQTGSLTITNTRTTDSGLYQLNIKRENQVKKFNVNIYSRLPVPVISSNSSQNSSSSSNCSVVCSVLNVSHVTLSWYKGNSLLSNISVSDLSISLSLPLEVKCLDDSYSCVVSYSFTDQTTDLNNTELCPTCAAHSLHIVLISAAAAGSLLIVAGFGIFCICRKHRKADQDAQTQEITYADPTFYKRKAHQLKAKEEDEVVYAGVNVRR